MYSQNSENLISVKLCVFLVAVVKKTLFLQQNQFDD